MDVIYLAGGIGSRMNLQYPKQFIKLNGKPMFIYGLEILKQCKEVENIILACNEANINDYKFSLYEYGIDNVKCIIGGNTRQESVYKSLLHVKTRLVLIHEAARPLISYEFVESIIRNECIDAVVPTIPLRFTVAIGSEYMEQELDRSKLHNIQLPQLFNTSCLLDAHKKAIVDNYLSTEDGMLVFRYGGKVKFVEGRESNIKITTLFDVEIAEKLLKL